MRLFIALELTEPIKRTLRSLALDIKQNSEHARLAREENMHITLAFLGELPQEKLGAVRRCMERVQPGAFSLELEKLGVFRRCDGDTWWLGVRKTPELLSLQSSLCAELGRAGFRLEEREFRPHITLCRDTVLKPYFKSSDIELPELEQTADHITLFESARERGRLVYLNKCRTEL